jgi:hypothetical protein
MKFCKDCKWVGTAPTFNASECRRPELGFNLVTGKSVYRDCDLERYNELESCCGMIGRFFEARETQPSSETSATSPKS